jgi:hypothetical protein
MVQKWPVEAAFLLLAKFSPKIRFKIFFWIEMQKN